ncbi:MAG: ribulose-phosphate 3-epimerase [Patescibacteria group bacterium]
METIPVINCPDFECVKKRVKQIKELGSPLAHIDVSDGEFAKPANWGNPLDLLSFGEELAGLKLEVHLMVLEPQAVVEDWLRAGVSRIIIHEEALTDGWPIIFDKIDTYDAELGLAIKPETSIETVVPYLKQVSLVQILAVDPGPSGQKFDMAVLEKISFLNKEKEDNNFIIEVDGGIDLETAALVRDAGADLVVSHSYIFESSDPKEAYESLKNL